MIGKKNLRPTEKLYLQILDLQGIEYALCDAEHKIQAHSPRLPRIVNKSEAELLTTPLEWLLDEFTGLESYLEQVRLKTAPVFKLEKVWREWDNGRSGYFTFTVAPFEEGLLLIVSDVSPESYKEQALTQQRNELHLLNHRFKMVRTQLDDLLRRFIAQEITAHIEVDDAQQTATILFADLLGLTDWATEIAAEAMGDLLNQTLETAVAAIQKADGLIDHYVGDAILGIFTPTVAGADHARKAIEIGWHFLQSMREVDAFDFSIGIHTGPIMLGKIGLTPHISYTALGETTKIAKQLQQNSPTNTILISPATYQQVAGQITTGQIAAAPFAPATLSGDAPALVAYQVTSLHPKRQHNDDEFATRKG